MPPKSQDDHSDHKHFLCTGCGTGFCSSHENYKNLKDGDPCPECHIAMVAAVDVMRLPLAPDFDELFKPLLDKMEAATSEQESSRRITRILDAAAQLFPYITHVFPSPEDAGVRAVGGEIADPAIARSLRSVEVAFGMEAAIRARLDKEAGL